MNNRQCQVCTGPGKYRCPADNVVTCSLKCVKEHKSVDSCSGVRNRAKMVSKRNYTEDHFMSDFTLLEDAGRVVDAADRTLSALMNGKGISGGLMNRLKQEAAKRNIRLSFMPKGLARHGRNTSQIKSAPKSRVLAAGLKGAHLLFWHIDVYFAGLTTGSNQLVKVESCAEDYNIETIVRGALTTLQKRNKRRRTDVHSMERNTAALYEKTETSDLAVYLQNEHVTSTIPAVHTKGFAANSDCDMHRYVLLDQSITLLQSLKGRAIIEFPVLYVATKGSAAAKRLATTTFGLFEKPEPDALSDSSECSDSSDSESDGEIKKKKQHTMDAIRKEIFLNGKNSDGGLVVRAEHVAALNAGKSVTTPKAVAPVDIPKVVPKAPLDASKPAEEEKKVEKSAVKKTVEFKVEGKTTERRLSSERRSEGRKSRFDSLENLSKQTKSKAGSSGGTPVAESDAKVQKPTGQEKKDADLVPDFDHATHPTGLFDLPLPEGRVPRKPKTAIA